MLGRRCFSRAAWGPKRVRVSGTVSAIELSAIKEMAIFGAKVPGAASLAWGLPSFRTPAHIRRAVER
jgi:hypothetical protein